MVAIFAAQRGVLSIAVCGRRAVHHPAGAAGRGSSWFSFTVILNPKLDMDRREVMGAMKDADIGYRIITGGCFLRHDVIKYFDYDTVGEIVNANIAHDRGFFVGNHPRDLTPQIERFHQVLDRAAVPGRRSVVSV